MFEDTGWSDLGRPNPLGTGLAEEVEWQEEDLDPESDTPENEPAWDEDSDVGGALGIRADGRSKGDEDEDEEAEDEEFEDDEEEFEDDEDLDEEFDEFDEEEELDEEVDEEMGEEEEDV
jgi:hypothetical protein